jgi:hypothetical protein
MKIKIVEKKYFSIVIILSTAVLFTLPQIISQGMIIGSDAIFHFNRFYDTGMQIKTGNFNYFLSGFGFQQTGRIVNPFYGPLMAYIQGTLLLISGSWFRYQILSNIILYSISGISMFTLLKKNKISEKTCLFIAIIFMTTYSIHYWTISQGFSSWGAAVFPFTLIPLRTIVLEDKIPILQISLSVAIMLNIHLFSCLLLVIVYTIVFSYSFIRSKNKAKMLENVLFAVFLFAMLTMNIWMNMLHLYQSNKIIPPFINKELYLATIDRSSWYWLVNPIFLLMIIIHQFWYLISQRKKMSLLNKCIMLCALVFFILSSSLFPWKYLQKLDIGIIQRVQFPFRFFIPFTVLILLSYGLSLEEKKEKSKHTILITLFSIIQVLLTSGYGLAQWLLNDAHSFESLHTHIQILPSSTIKQSFFSNDLSIALKYWEKSTPDYLPLYHETTENKYQLYEKFILQNHRAFKKTAEDKGILIEWLATEEREISLPVIFYKQSMLTVNQQDIAPKREELSTIGTPVIQQRVGKNYAILQYRTPRGFIFSLVLTFLSWTACFFYYLVKKYSRK